MLARKGFFTAENAAFYAKKSHAPGSARHAPPPPPVIVPLPVANEQSASDELVIVNEQIKRAREELNDETPFCTKCERPALQPHHRAMLMKALDGFIERRYIIVNGGKPGTVKGKASKAVKLPEQSLTPDAPIPAPETMSQPVTGDWADTLF